METILTRLHQMVWGPWTLLIFLMVGIGYTVKGGGFQLWGFSFWWRYTAGSLIRNRENLENGDVGERNSGKKGISQFQSVCTALAATVGTGNIAGVATALTAGGPGALVWMWICAGIGMATAYGETFLGLKSRRTDQMGHYICGPFIYMEDLLGTKWLGRIYGVLCILCSLGMGSMVQANSAVNSVAYSWNVQKGTAGVLLTGAVLLVVAGGIGRIGRAAEMLVPAASGIYILFSAIVIFSCFRQLPGAVREIFTCGFTPRAAAGGAAGYGLSQAVRYGMARGVFSNEAGLGTLAILHGAAEDTTPCQQGMWAMFEVFFDTVVLCTLTALVILCTTDSLRMTPKASGAALAAWCFGTKLGRGGEMLISGSMAVFAFATMIAWFYLGRQAVSYVSQSLRVGRKFSEKTIQIIYPLLFLAAVFAGGLWSSEAVWILSDLWNGLMAFPNLTALIFLQKKVAYPQWKK